MNKNIFLAFAITLTSITAFAKEGKYLEFKISGGPINGTAKVWSADGNTRSEMNMTTPASPNPINVATLVLAADPGKAYTINEKDKTYTESSTGKTDNNDDDYEITVIGKEKVNDYNCMHVSIKYRTAQHTAEMWLSKDIKSYASYLAIKNKYLGGAKFFEALKEKGADGFVVRILTNTGRGNMQMDLVAAETKNIDESMLSLSGYTKATASSAHAMPGGVDVEAIQKMTPEERKKYIDDMKAKYQQAGH